MAGLEKPAVSLRFWQHGVVFLLALIILDLPAAGRHLSCAVRRRRRKGLVSGCV